MQLTANWLWVNRIILSSSRIVICGLTVSQSKRHATNPVNTGILHEVQNAARRGKFMFAASTFLSDRCLFDSKTRSTDGGANNRPNANSANRAHCMAEVFCVGNGASNYAVEIIHYPSRTVYVHFASQIVTPLAVRTKPKPIDDLGHFCPWP